MGLRFRKVISIMPGVRVNLSLRGASVSVGPRGASLNFGRQGAFLNAGLPGTGLSYRQRLFAPTRSVQSNLVAVAGLDAENANDNDLQEAANRYNGLVEHLAHVHWTTPLPSTPPTLDANPFDIPEPIKPTLGEASFFERWLPSLRQQRQLADKATMEAYEGQLAAWVGERARHNSEEAQQQARYSTGIRESISVALEVLNEQASSEHWSFPFRLQADGDPAWEWVYLSIDLPEIEEFPSQTAEISRSGLRWVRMSETSRRRLYAQYIHGLVFKIIGLAFSCVPRACSVTAVAYTQRPLLKQGQSYDAYVLSVAVPRVDWSAIRFEQIQTVDPIEELTRFDLRREMDRRFELHAITPHAKPTSGG